MNALLVHSMTANNILITGGAGFVGSNLAVMFRRRFPERQVWAFDNLRRRGSELTLPRLREAGVIFIHGDIRCGEDFERLPRFDLLIDCSAEPSVHAGAQGSPTEVLNINLLGTINCLEMARKAGASFLFLSTSRVYPIQGLNGIPWIEDEQRFRWSADFSSVGLSKHGVTEEFPLTGARSFYGATKLACELLIQEYHQTCGVPALINRCGILAGPWQMGKVDQGVVTLWVARHHFMRPLQYIGFEGTGKQVRDLLHIEDLFDLLVRQIETDQVWDARVYNVGGGPEISVSLRELTDLCQKVTGNCVAIDEQGETSPLDVRIFLTDSRFVRRDFGWQPKQNAEQIVRDIHRWINRHERLLAPVLA